MKFQSSYWLRLQASEGSNWAWALSLTKLLAWGLPSLPHCPLQRAAHMSVGFSQGEWSKRMTVCTQDRSLGVFHHLISEVTYHHTSRIPTLLQGCRRPHSIWTLEGNICGPKAVMRTRRVTVCKAVWFRTHVMQVLYKYHNCYHQR